ncbi:hypothetical protein J5893_03570 [bacterium]|nr:hypothetical protein [bacterium]
MKYGLFLLFIVLCVLVINTYVNYSTILETIDTVSHKTDLVQNEMDYSKYFQLRYLASEYGHLFLAHDNNIVFRGEVVIGFKNTQDLERTLQDPLVHRIPDRSQTQELEKVKLTPQEGWKLFLQEKLDI